MAGVDLLRHRLRAHGLAGAPFTTPDAVVGWMGAMQAQELALAKWSIGQRARSVTEADVDAAIATGAILRTHVLRPTWHFVHPADVRWMLRITAPRIKAAMASTERKIGLDAELVTRSRRAVAAALANGRHLTRPDLSRVLAEAGVQARGQLLAHLVMHLELDAVICSGTPRNGKQTYALLDERAPEAAELDPDDALAELAARYFTSHGPATLRDFRWWSSLTALQAKRAIDAAGTRLARDGAAGRTCWFAASLDLPPVRRSPTTHLLQLYDEYVIAYTESRDLIAPTVPSFREGGFHGPLIVRGRVAGHWRSFRSATSGTVEVSYSDDTTRPPERGVRRAMAAMAAFHQLSDVRLVDVADIRRERASARIVAVTSGGIVRLQ